MSMPDTNIVPLMIHADPSLEALEAPEPIPSRVEGPDPVTQGLSVEVAAQVMAQISSALALIQAIDYGELLAVPPEDEAERKRHRTALSMIDLMEQELSGALVSLKLVLDRV